MSSCCFWALSVRPFATRRRWEMSARPRESASVRVRVLNEDLGGRHRLEMVAEAPVLRAARLRLSLPLRPEPRSRQLSVSRPPNPLASVPSSQGSLYCTHGDVWPGWASPQNPCWLALAGGSFPCPQCVYTGVSAPGCIRDALPHRHGSSTPGRSRAAGGPPRGPSRGPGRAVLDRMHVTPDCWAEGTGCTSPRIAGLRAGVPMAVFPAQNPFLSPAVRQALT